MQLRDIMTLDVAVIHPDASLAEAARQVRRLPVVNRDKRLVWIVSLDDLAARAGDERLTGAAAAEVSEERAAAISGIKRT